MSEAPQPDAAQLRPDLLEFRILYAGPEGSTKAHTLRVLQAARGEGSKLEVFLIEGARLLRLRLEGRARIAAGYRSLFEILSFPGRSRAPAARRLLLQSADGVVFLPKRDDPGGKETRSSWRRLQKQLEELERDELPIIVPNYQDCDAEISLRDLPTREKGLEPRLMSVDGDFECEVTRIFAALETQLLEQALEEGIVSWRRRRNARQWGLAEAASPRAWAPMLVWSAGILVMALLSWLAWILVLEI